MEKLFISFLFSLFLSSFISAQTFEKDLCKVGYTFAINLPESLYIKTKSDEYTLSLINNGLQDFITLSTSSNLINHKEDISIEFTDGDKLVILKPCRLEYSQFCNNCLIEYRYLYEISGSFLKFIDNSSNSICIKIGGECVDSVNFDTNLKTNLHKIVKNFCIFKKIEKYEKLID